MAAKTTYSAIAKKFIKYNGKFIKEGEKFNVKIEDAEEMKVHADIKIPATEGNQQDGNQDGNQDGKAGA
ncbi:hypothetical protein [Clostridium beijerinckii]|uniref:DUF7210 family protein n=1 Tax=Clostridium beijerinckii TaxID=1520 RepID=UPI001361E42E|nr:hypothetical protein [Clostridium beijerinckii]MZK53671.1 hypothetical protein [Clostridium beijerinckii]MZK61800.1 hypothetical protein [Clostridium beijerinckii]MZK71981.1 hypothetical protein [Clostridium beijerinckii]MZK77374.1 hypothetical protein [Clostridium beijerinckii]MZK86952.1 hypothetical protein [Clostridium beijerinckii]